MEELRIKAKELLAAGTVKVVIGYGKCTADARHPIFVRSADKVNELVFDASYTQNLATYLTKAEVRAMGRMAIVAAPSTLRSILQLAAERQESLRFVVRTFAQTGIPAPAMMAALAYFDSFRSKWLPANLIQAQRDYFGSHTYERLDAKGTFHTLWHK